MMYVTGRISNKRRGGDIEHGEYVGFDLLDFGQDIHLSVRDDDPDLLASYHKLSNGDEVSIPCQIRAGKGRDGQVVTYYNVRGVAHIDRSAAQVAAADAAARQKVS